MEIKRGNFIGTLFDQIEQEEETKPYHAQDLKDSNNNKIWLDKKKGG